MADIRINKPEELKNSFFVKAEYPEKNIKKIVDSIGLAILNMKLKKDDKFDTFKTLISKDPGLKIDILGLIDMIGFENMLPSKVTPSQVTAFLFSLRTLQHPLFKQPEVIPEPTPEKAPVIFYDEQAGEPEATQKEEEVTFKEETGDASIAQQLLQEEKDKVLSALNPRIEEASSSISDVILQRIQKNISKIELVRTKAELIVLKSFIEADLKSAEKEETVAPTSEMEEELEKINSDAEQKKIVDSQFDVYKKISEATDVIFSIDKETSSQVVPFKSGATLDQALLEFGKSNVKSDKLDSAYDSLFPAMTPEDGKIIVHKEKLSQSFNIFKARIMDLFNQVVPKDPATSKSEGVTRPSVQAIIAANNIMYSAKSYDKKNLVIFNELKRELTDSLKKTRDSKIDLSDKISSIEVARKEYFKNSLCSMIVADKSFMEKLATLTVYLNSSFGYSVRNEGQFYLNEQGTYSRKIMPPKSIAHKFQGEQGEIELDRLYKIYIDTYEKYLSKKIISYFKDVISESSEKSYCQYTSISGSVISDPALNIFLNKNKVAQKTSVVGPCPVCARDIDLSTTKEGLEAKINIYAPYKEDGTAITLQDLMIDESGATRVFQPPKQSDFSHFSISALYAQYNKQFSYSKIDMLSSTGQKQDQIVSLILKSSALEQLGAKRLKEDSISNIFSLCPMGTDESIVACGLSYSGTGSSVDSLQPTRAKVSYGRIEPEGFADEIRTKIKRKTSGGLRFSSTIFRCPCHIENPEDLEKEYNTKIYNHHSTLAISLQGPFDPEKADSLYLPTQADGSKSIPSAGSMAYLVCGANTSISLFDRSADSDKSLMNILKKMYVLNRHQYFEMVDALAMSGLSADDLLSINSYIVKEKDSGQGEEYIEKLSNEHYSKFVSAAVRSTDIETLKDLGLICPYGHKFTVKDSLNFASGHASASINQKNYKSFFPLVTSTGKTNLQNCLKAGFLTKEPDLVKASKNAISFQEWLSADDNFKEIDIAKPSATIKGDFENLVTPKILIDNEAYIFSGMRLSKSPWSTRRKAKPKEKTIYDKTSFAQSYSVSGGSPDEKGIGETLLDKKTFSDYQEQEYNDYADDVASDMEDSWDEELLTLNYSKFKNTITQIPNTESISSLLSSTKKSDDAQKISRYKSSYLKKAKGVVYSIQALFNIVKTWNSAIKTKDFGNKLFYQLPQGDDLAPRISRILESDFDRFFSDYDEDDFDDEQKKKAIEEVAAFVSSEIVANISNYGIILHAKNAEDYRKARILIESAVQEAEDSIAAGLDLSLNVEEITSELVSKSNPEILGVTFRLSGASAFKKVDEKEKRLAFVHLSLASFATRLAQDFEKINNSYFSELGTFYVGFDLGDDFNQQKILSLDKDQIQGLASIPMTLNLDNIIEEAKDRGFSMSEQLRVQNVNEDEEEDLTILRDYMSNLDTAYSNILHLIATAKEEAYNPATITSVRKNVINDYFNAQIASLDEDINNQNQKILAVKKSRESAYIINQEEKKLEPLMKLKAIREIQDPKEKAAAIVKFKESLGDKMKLSGILSMFHLNFSKLSNDPNDKDSYQMAKFLPSFAKDESGYEYFSPHNFDIYSKKDASGHTYYQIPEYGFDNRKIQIGNWSGLNSYEQLSNPETLWRGFYSKSDTSPVGIILPLNDIPDTSKTVAYSLVTILNKKVFVTINGKEYNIGFLFALGRTSEEVDKAQELFKKIQMLDKRYQQTGSASLKKEIDSLRASLMKIPTRIRSTQTWGAENFGGTYNYSAGAQKTEMSISESGMTPKFEKKQFRAPLIPLYDPKTAFQVIQNDVFFNHGYTSEEDKQNLIQFIKDIYRLDSIATVINENEKRKRDITADDLLSGQHVDGEAIDQSTSGHAKSKLKRDIKPNFVSINNKKTQFNIMYDALGRKADAEVLSAQTLNEVAYSRVELGFSHYQKSKDWDVGQEAATAMTKYIEEFVKNALRASDEEARKPLFRVSSEMPLDMRLDDALRRIRKSGTIVMTEGSNDPEAFINSIIKELNENSLES